MRKPIRREEFWKHLEDMAYETAGVYSEEFDTEQFVQDPDKISAELRQIGRAHV